MELPPSIPNQQRNLQAIQALLARVRSLDKSAKTRLDAMLEQEMDLPYLDVMEREYAKAFRSIAPQHATALRGRFVAALNEQRAFLIAEVRKVLHEGESNSLHNFGPQRSRIENS